MSPSCQPGLVRSDETPRNVIPSSGACSDRRPMYARRLSMRIVVMTGSPFLHSQSPAIESCGLGKSFGSRAALVGRRSRGRAPWKRAAPLQRSHTCSAAISYAVYASASSPPCASSRGTPGTSRTSRQTSDVELEPPPSPHDVISARRSLMAGGEIGWQGARDCPGSSPRLRTMATLDIAAEAVTRTSGRSALSMKSASRSSQRAWSVRWGPSGSGKTTTLRILLGLVTATVTLT